MRERLGKRVNRVKSVVEREPAKAKVVSGRESPALKQLRAAARY